MAINESEPGGQDPTRGTGRDKVTVATDPDLEAAPAAQSNESNEGRGPDPARGGCLNFGWGCLPVVLVVLLPTGMLF